MEIVLKDYFDTKVNAVEAKITNNAQVVSTELAENFNSYSKAVAKDNKFKNHKLKQTLQQRKRKKQMCNFEK